MKCFRCNEEASVRMHEKRLNGVAMIYLCKNCEKGEPFKEKEPINTPIITSRCAEVGMVKGIDASKWVIVSFISGMLAGASIATFVAHSLMEGG